MKLSFIRIKKIVTRIKLLRGYKICMDFISTFLISCNEKNLQTFENYQQVSSNEENINKYYHQLKVKLKTKSIAQEFDL